MKMKDNVPTSHPQHPAWQCIITLLFYLD